MPRPLRRSPFGSLRPFLAAAAALTISGLSCSPGPTTVTPKGAHIVLVSFDGLRPDAITETSAPTLMQLAKQGAAATRAQTVLPSLTLPSHTSMVTGLLPENHHILRNDDTSGDTSHVIAATMFDLAKQAGFSSAMFVGKSKLNAVVHVGAPTTVDAPPIGTVWKSDTVAAHLRKYLKFGGQPNVMFVHFPDIDVAGHTFGWMSPDYMAAVRHTDSVFARVWLDLKTSLGTDLVVIVTADHGGLGNNHSAGSELDRTVPWIAWGKDVSPTILSVDVRAVDAGPTVLWVLGIPLPAGLDGVPVKSAFPTLAH